jgi:hypothetical protein
MQRVILAAFVIPLILSCAGTETVEPVNQAPTIEFTFEPIAVRENTAADLTVSVSDPDGDALTVSWQITGGSLAPQNSQRTIMRWTPPRGVGTDTIVVTVSDGALSATTGEVEIKRATWGTYVNLDDWTFERLYSPYILIPDGETVGFTGTVTVEPGVELYIGKPNIAIEVVGTMVSNGTDANPVLIRPNARLECEESRGWWKGILVTLDQGAGSADLSYTEISHAENNVWVFRGSASATLDHCIIKCSSDAGVKMQSSGTLAIDYCDVFDNDTHGIEISGEVALPTRVDITNSRIHHNAHGIYMDLRDWDQSVPITVERNLIEWNAENGIELARGVWPSIEYNDFWLNNTPLPLVHIALDLSFAHPDSITTPQDWISLPALHNFWGQEYESNEGDRIKDMVYDREANSLLPTTIVVDPWENTKQSPWDIGGIGSQ